MPLTNDLTARPGLEPSVPESLSFEHRAAIWVEVMDASEKLLLAGLARQIGPEGDLRAAYRAWYAQQMEEHDRAVEQLAANMDRDGMRRDC